MWGRFDDIGSLYRKPLVDPIFVPIRVRALYPYSRSIKASKSERRPALDRRGLWLVLIELDDVLVQLIQRFIFIVAILDRDVQFAGKQFSCFLDFLEFVLVLRIELEIRL